MAGISLTGNFELNIAAPIDNRLVASNSTVRDAIEFKYIGLKVFDLSDGRTYVWGTNSSWLVDGGNAVTGASQAGGIYGGSGSLPDDVIVDFGLMGTVQDDKSKKLTFKTYDSDEESRIDSYFYRRSTSGSYTEMSYRIDHILAPDILPEEQSGFIDFNSLDSYFPSHVGNISLGTRRNQFDTTIKGQKIIIGAKNYISLDPTGDVSVFPLTIGVEGFNVNLGVNYNPNSDGISSNGQQAYNSGFGSGRFQLNTDNTTYQSRNEEGTTWHDLLFIDNLSNPNQETSLLQFRIDNSAKDWDNNAVRDSKLRTIADFTRNSEHRFTMVQSWNWKNGGYSFKNKELLLPPTGNSFDVVMAGNDYIKDIKIFRGGSLTSAYPEGTILIIKFINNDSTRPGYISVNNTGSLIESNFNDSDFGGDTTSTAYNQRVTIINNTTKYKYGDIITFRKVSGKWEIVNLNRYKKLTERNYLFNEGLITDPWYFVSSGQVRYLNTFANNRSFLSLPRSSVTYYSTSTGNTPNKFPFSVVSSSANRETTNPDGFKFQISVDGNRIVHAQGNFRITMPDVYWGPQGGGTVQLFLTAAHSRGNLIRVGKINNLELLPRLETTWAFVSGYGIDTKNTGNTFTLSNAYISINAVGEIFVYFDLTYSGNLTTFRSGDAQIDIWVPPFSYPSATASITGGGGGSGPVVGT